MSKILVTGAGGFVGANVAFALSDNKIDCLGIDLNQGGLEKGIHFIKCDILDEDHLDKIFKGVDIVVHMAVSDRRTSLTNPKLNVRVNINGTLNILEAAVKHGIKKIIYLSASSVYGTPKYSPVKEDHPKDPTTVYGVSKFAGEELIRVYQKLHNIDYFILRLTNVFGPRQYPYTKMLIPVVLDRIHKKETIVIYGDGTQTRDFVYVGDVSRLVIDVINDEKKKNTEVNIGTGEQTSILEVIKTCGEVTGIEPVIEFKEQEAGERAAFCADMTRCKEVFGYIPDTRLKDGMLPTVQWFNSHIWEK